MQKFTDVQLLKFTEQDGGSLGCSKQTENGVLVCIDNQRSSLILSHFEGSSGGKERELSRMPLGSLSCCQLTERTLALRPTMDFNVGSLVLQFPCTTDTSSFRKALFEAQRMGNNSGSIFDQRTEESSAVQYFQFYGYLSQQQNMLQDYVRTATYQKAILSNLGDFKDKIVLDVGAGSGILSFFALEAGARRVYAVEASSMAKHCETLVRANGFSDRICVIPGKIEDISLPEKVDLIISEPMGYMLLNERMLESFLHAKKFLKPQGSMYPSRGDLHVAPFTDESLYLEQNSKAGFWCQESFHGVNLSQLRPQALKEYLRQPIVDTWHIGILMARSHCWSVDFLKADETDLHFIEIPFNFTLQSTGYIHGLAFWFDVAFVGCSQTVWLSTSPTEPLTHWYQVRCLLDNPVLGKVGQACTGKVVLKANTRQSYYVDIELVVDGRKATNSLDLKNPYFRYTGQPVVAPPGHQTGNTSPTENYWNTSTTTMQQENTAVSSNGGYAQVMNGSGAYTGMVNAESLVSQQPYMTSAHAHGAMAGQQLAIMDLMLASQQATPFGGIRPTGAAVGTDTVGAGGVGGLVTSLPLKMNPTTQQPQQSLPFSSPAYPQLIQQAAAAAASTNRSGAGSPLGARQSGDGPLGVPSAGFLPGHPNPWSQQ